MRPSVRSVDTEKEQDRCYRARLDISGLGTQFGQDKVLVTNIAVKEPLGVTCDIRKLASRWPQLSVQTIGKSGTHILSSFRVGGWDDKVSVGGMTWGGQLAQQTADLLASDIWFGA
jgi:hypothetical protein